MSVTERSGGNDGFIYEIVAYLSYIHHILRSPGGCLADCLYLHEAKVSYFSVNGWSVDLETDPYVFGLGHFNIK